MVSHANSVLPKGSEPEPISFPTRAGGLLRALSTMASAGQLVLTYLVPVYGLATLTGSCYGTVVTDTTADQCPTDASPSRYRAGTDGPSAGLPPAARA